MLLLGFAKRIVLFAEWIIEEEHKIRRIYRILQDLEIEYKQRDFKKIHFASSITIHGR